MPPSGEYITRLIQSLRKLHGCKAVHVESITAREMFRGKKMWEREVEKFELKKHPKAKFAYAWGDQNPEDEDNLEVTTVLELPPVKSAVDAVRLTIAAQNR